MAVALVAGGHGAPVDLSRRAPATFATEPPGYEVARVVRVVDGDTAVVAIARRVDGPGAGDTRPGRRYTVRFLGIDTPETVKPGTPVQCYGPEASAATHALLDGARVRLVRDVEDRDAYGRLLRYVYLGDEMVDARLVVNGYARTLPYAPNLRHAALLEALQDEARSHGWGLWGRSTCAGRR